MELRGHSREGQRRAGASEISRQPALPWRKGQAPSATPLSRPVRAACVSDIARLKKLKTWGCGLIPVTDALGALPGGKR